MEPLVTIATFTYPHELTIIRSRLEAEGIRCVVKDELTVTVHNFYSNAIGGIKLRVKKTDVPRAIEILKENGINAEQDFQSDHLLDKLERITDEIPFLQSMSLHLRLIAIALVTAIILMWLIYTYFV